MPWIEPADVAPVVVFLSSDAARMDSGTTYDVTGGGALTMQRDGRSLMTLIGAFVVETEARAALGRDAVAMRWSQTELE